jgi:type VI secretion system secreted protein VgrG
MMMKRRHAAVFILLVSVMMASSSHGLQRSIRGASRIQTDSKGTVQTDRRLEYCVGVGSCDCIVSRNGNGKGKGKGKNSIIGRNGKGRNSIGSRSSKGEDSVEYTYIDCPGPPPPVPGGESTPSTSTSGNGLTSPKNDGPSQITGGAAPTSKPVEPTTPPSPTEPTNAPSQDDGVLVKEPTSLLNPINASNSYVLLTDTPPPVSPSPSASPAPSISTPPSASPAPSISTSPSASPAPTEKPYETEETPNGDGFVSSCKEDLPKNKPVPKELTANFTYVAIVTKGANITEVIRDVESETHDALASDLLNCMFSSANTMVPDEVEYTFISSLPEDAPNNEACKNVTANQDCYVIVGGITVGYLPPQDESAILEDVGAVLEENYDGGTIADGNDDVVELDFIGFTDGDASSPPSVSPSPTTSPAPSISASPSASPAPTELPYATEETPNGDGFVSSCKEDPPKNRPAPKVLTANYTYVAVVTKGANITLVLRDVESETHEALASDLLNCMFSSDDEMVPDEVEYTFISSLPEDAPSKEACKNVTANQDCYVIAGGITVGFLPPQDERTILEDVGAVLEESYDGGTIADGNDDVIALDYIGFTDGDDPLTSGSSGSSASSPPSVSPSPTASPAPSISASPSVSPAPTELPYGTEETPNGDGFVSSCEEDPPKNRPAPKVLTANYTYVAVVTKGANITQVCATWSPRRMKPWPVTCSTACSLLMIRWCQMMLNTRPSHLFRRIPRTTRCARMSRRTKTAM